MPVTTDSPAPYAPSSAVLGLIERHRSRGLPSPVDADVLARAGISASLIPRTLQTLQTLDLIDETGKPTETLEAIRLAPENEYKQRLADWLNHAYADALAFVDPATADDTAIRDAFRNYKPVGMQSRMVTLFTGLFTAAGLMPERERQPQRRQQSNNGVRQTPRRQSSRHTPPAKEPPPTYSSTLPPALAGLLASLPSEKTGWTKEKRDLFVTTFSAVLDFCIPIRESAEQELEEESDSEDTA